MTHWLTLSALTAQKWHSPDLALLRDTINRQIAAQIESRSQLATVGSELLQQDILTVDSSVVFQSDCPVQNRFDVLQSELRLRLEIDRFYSAENVDREAAVQSALRAKTKAEQTVRAGLVRLGWSDTTNLQIPGAIPQGHILSNPEVRRLRDELRELSQRPDALINGNREAVEALRQTLETMRRAALQPA